MQAYLCKVFCEGSDDILCVLLLEHGQGDGGLAPTAQHHKLDQFHHGRLCILLVPVHPLTGHRLDTEEEEQST